MSEDIIRRFSSENYIDEDNFHHCNIKEYEYYVKYMNTAQLWKELYRKEHQKWKTGNTYKKIQILKEKIEKKELEQFYEKHKTYLKPALELELYNLKHKVFKDNLDKKKIIILTELIKNYKEDRIIFYNSYSFPILI